MLFGQTIEVGDEELFIEDAVIDDLGTVRRKLASNDRDLVALTVSSLTGTARVVVQNAPHLPQGAWDPNIQALIDIGPALDECLADRYNSLAASTTADLTDEERSGLSARLELSENAVLVND
jgi:hypothetical protein